ncbi:N-acyl homoserine lactonase family protein [Pseudonocardia pini]|uniref:N-acyl homoserine lactonase family protein n=1 Tax=Pseudonocardia pini TaxID=2758030 RepID=UPI0015EFE597|nr:N-acyl homoserine lactonase family protein [Pseudonocardia pini]
MTARTEVLAVRFGRHRMRRSAYFLHYEGYGEPDDDIDLDYSLWVVRGPSGTVVVDTGFAPEVGARRGREVLADPVEALAAAGIDASSVGTVVVTHAHYDHIGNLDRFPSAEIVMARREYEFWQGPFASRPHFAQPTEATEIGRLATLRAEGRVTLFDGGHRIGPGVELVELGGHTPGQLVVVVEGEDAGAVLASDAIHSYEEYERDRPFGIVGDVAAMYAAFDRIREIEQRPGTQVVPGHDPAVLERFEVLPDAAGAAVRRVL